jgi:hypothetical protein
LTTTTDPTPTSTAQQAARVLVDLMDSFPWMPPIQHFEIATTDDVWGIHLEVDTENPSDASGWLTRLAGQVGAGFPRTDDLTMHVDFTHLGIPVRVWYLKPVQQWIVPEHCATCPTKLGSPDVPFVKLTPHSATIEQIKAAPVICMTCRDRMHRAWAGSASRFGASEGLDDKGLWLNLQHSVNALVEAGIQIFPGNDGAGELIDTSEYGSDAQKMPDDRTRYCLTVSSNGRWELGTRGPLNEDGDE